VHEYRIEKLRLALSLRLLGGEVIDGHVFLQPATYGGGRESAMHLLNAPEPFLPIDQEGRGILLVSKDRLLEAWGEAMGDEDELRLATARAVHVELQLPGCTMQAGTILLEVPADRPRVLDFLNDNQQRFIRLNTGAGALAINSRLIESARPLG
jgi:hypothetical protein